MRVIVTGCRDWQDRDRVWSELAAFLAHHKAFESVTVVHGACPTGADQFASQWATNGNLCCTQEETHPADWRLHGKAAGPRRNEEMARLGADLCLAFWDGVSAGTRDMITRAVAHGIPVRIVPKGRAG